MGSALLRPEPVYGRFPSMHSLSGLGRIRSFLREESEVLLAFFASRALLWAVAWFSVHTLRHGKFAVSPGSALWDLLYHWDATWYGAIAQFGYSYTPGVESNVAFFPLFPLCLGAAEFITRASPAFAGFLFSNAALLGAVILLRRLVARDFPAPSRVPARTVWLLLLCPVAFFQSAAYTESLFLLVSLMALYAAREQRWIVAAMAGALLSATRSNGFLIALPLFYEAWIQNRKDPELRGRLLDARLWLFIVPLGLVAYMAYLQWRFGDPIAFVHAQAGWHRGFDLIWRTLHRSALVYSRPYRFLFYSTAVLSILLFVAACRVRLRPSYLIYTAAMLLLYLSSTLYESLPRYLSVIFPLQLTAAVLTARSEGLYVALLMASTGLMAICLALYVCGYWMT